MDSVFLLSWCGPELRVKYSSAWASACVTKYFMRTIIFYARVAFRISDMIATSVLQSSLKPGHFDTQELSAMLLSNLLPS